MKPRDISDFHRTFNSGIDVCIAARKQTIVKHRAIHYSRIVTIGKFLLLMAALLVAAPACTCFRDVRQYAASSRDTALAISTASDDIYSTCVRAEAYKVPPADTIPPTLETVCTDDKDTADTVRDTAELLSAYSQILLEMASDRHPRYDAERITASVSYLEGFQENSSGQRHSDFSSQVRQLDSSIVKAVENGYGRTQVAKFLRDNDPAINTIVDFLHQRLIGYCHALTEEGKAQATAEESLTDQQFHNDHLQWAVFRQQGAVSLAERVQKIRAAEALDKTIIDLGETHGVLADRGSADKDVTALDAKSKILRVRLFAQATEYTLRQARAAFHD